MNTPSEKQKKTKKKTALEVFNTILSLIALVLIVTAFIHGQFIKKTTIETCNGVATNCKGDERICQAIMKATLERIATTDPWTGQPIENSPGYNEDS